MEEEGREYREEFAEREEESEEGREDKEEEETEGKGIEPERSPNLSRRPVGVRASRC